METYSSKISENGGDELMSSRQDSLVKSTAWQERDLEIKMTVTSGRKCFVSSTKSGPLGSLVKTLLESSRWYSPARRLRWEVTRTFAERVTRCTKPDKSTLSSRSSETSNQSDIPSSQFVYRLVPSERPTGEIVYGSLLPTPMAQDYRRRGPNSDQQGLPEMAYNGMLPTPTAIDSGSGRINKSKSLNAKERPTIALAAKMGLLPTPAASNYKGAAKRETILRKGRNPETNDLPSYFSQVGKTSQLNPLFAAEMMGIPLDYLVSPFQDGDKNR